MFAAPTPLANVPLAEMPPDILAFIAAAFVIAGLVKGLTGLGLPAMSLGLMLLALELRDAMAVLVVPLFLTNVWQGVTGGQFRAIVNRLWPLFATGVVAVWFAVGVMIGADPAILAMGLGTVLAGYSAYSLATPQIRPPGHWEGVLSPLVGAVTGTIGGLTGSMAVPAVPYMQALGMNRDALIQAMGIWFSLGSAMLGVALGGRGAMPAALTVVSLGAVLPAVLGMELGRRLRNRLSEALFRKVFFTALLLLGLYIAGRGLLQA